MDMMKAVAAVESVPVIKPRRIPSPKVKNSVDRPKKRASKKPGKNDVDIFSVIGNPIKMSDEPVSDDGQQTKSDKKSKKKKKKKKSKKHDFSDVSSDGSFSVSSYGGESYMGSLGSMGSDSQGSYDSEHSFRSGSSFDGREKFTKAKRKEEIMQEKIEMLTRISNMSRMGFTATRKWSMKDDIDEIRFECYRMTRENNSRKSVKNMQHMLITAATIVEFANGLVNPFNLKLQGFSKNLMLTVSDYDDSLEELHHKWSGRTSVGPEMTVLFTFVTSAIFHHAGNVMSSPAENASKTNGPDMSSVLGLFSNMMPKTSIPTPTKSPEAKSEKGSKEPQRKRRPMKGPSGAGVPFANIIPSMQVPS